MKPIANFLLRGFLIYLLLYTFPFPLSYIPFGIGQSISESVSSFWQWVTPPTVKLLFGFTDELNFFGRGSGDTRYDYFLALVRLLFAGVFAFAWSFYEPLKRREAYTLSGLIILLRYYLAFILFSYGFSKIFYLQFPELNLMSLSMTYGGSSPMGLLWRFMGYSEAYSIFTGLMEFLGGLFLLFRKTKILGGLLTFAVMCNVFMLNMTFDVPVKLFSFHLWVITLVILSPDYPNIWRFLVLNKPTIPTRLKMYFSLKIRNQMGLAFKFLLIAHVLYTHISGKLQAQTQYGKRVPVPALYGIYDVKDFVVNSDTLPPLATDSYRWRTLIIDKLNSLIIRMDDERIGMRHRIDTHNQSIHLYPFLEGYQEYDFDYMHRDTVLILRGAKNGDTIVISLDRRSMEDFFLINRGFHWINEYPMQR